MKLSEHYTLEEATFSETALRKGIANVPDDATLARMQITAIGMERVRSLLGYRIHVNSWLRNLLVNRAVGSKDSSDHVLGYAVDFTCPDYGTPLEICKTLVASDVNFSQVINEGRWVHIAFNPAKERSVLTAHFVNGQVTYTKGL